MDVYVMKEGKRMGPYQPFLLKEMLDDGELTALDSVWHEGMDGWKPLGETDSLRSVWKKADPEPVEAPPQEEVAPHRPPAKTGLSVPQELTVALLQQRRALAWRRFFAKQIDLTIAVVCVVAAFAAFGWTDLWAFMAPDRWLIILAPALLWIPVEAALLTLFGWTPGRLTLGLRVVDENGNLPAFPSALKRSALLWAGGLGFGLPVRAILPLAQWMYSFWHFQRFGNTLWDHSAGTRVIFRELDRRHAAGLAVFTAAMASFTAWIFLWVAVPPRITGEDREAIEKMSKAVWKMVSPAAPPPNSGLPSPPGA